MSKFMIILLTAAILATGCADQPIEMNGAAALDFAGLDTGALDTGDTGFTTEFNGQKIIRREEAQKDKLGGGSAPNSRPATRGGS